MRSRIFAATGEEMFGKAIALALEAPPHERADLFERFACEIIAIVSADPQMRPWTCTVHPGLDGSRVFRGGTGLSLVIDPRGRLWRARSYEDFDTTYTITPNSCEIATLNPRYDQMREYVASGLPEAGLSREPNNEGAEQQVHPDPVARARLFWTESVGGFPNQAGSDSRCWLGWRPASDGPSLFA